MASNNRRELVRYTPNSYSGQLNTPLEGSSMTAGAGASAAAGGPSSRDLEKISHSPEGIPKDVIDELICRFLINLPESEMRSPRVFHHIKEACWFYADNFCTIAPKMYELPN